jgi:hypothetical protein
VDHELTVGPPAREPSVPSATAAGSAASPATAAAAPRDHHRPQPRTRPTELGDPALLLGAAAVGAAVALAGVALAARLRRGDGNGAHA